MRSVETTGKGKKTVDKELKEANDPSLFLMTLPFWCFIIRNAIFIYSSLVHRVEPGETQIVVLCFAGFLKLGREVC